MDNTDWNAAMSSEIFQLYVQNELIKEKNNVKTAEQKETEDLNIMQEFEDFQLKVNASPKLKTAFKQLQNIFMTNQEYTSKVNPKFVEGVLLLKIDE
jgi:hypothetical protein